MATKTKDQRPGTRSDSAIKVPAARTIEPEPGAATASSEPDLEARVKVRRVELVARLRELRQDTGAEAIAAGDKLKAKLSEVARLITDSVVDGWGSVGDNAKHRLERWLAESERPAPGETGKP